MNYVCGICGYVYEVDKGLLEDGFQPGTKFEDIPDCDWDCPLCGSPKDDFSPLDNIHEQ